MCLRCEVRICNSRDKLVNIYSSSCDSLDRYLDSRRPYAHTGWHAYLDVYDEDDMDKLVDRNVFVFLDGDWRN